MHPSSFSPAVHDLLNEGLRCLFLLTIPVLLALSAAGGLAALFQSSANIREPALNYCLKFLALLAVLFFLTPPAYEYLLTLFEMAFK